MLSIVVAKPNNITNEGPAFCMSVIVPNHRLAIAKLNAPGTNSHLQISAFTLMLRVLDLLTILDLARLLLSYMSDRRISFLPMIAAIGSLRASRLAAPGLESSHRRRPQLAPISSSEMILVSSGHSQRDGNLFG